MIENRAQGLCGIHLAAVAAIAAISGYSGYSGYEHRVENVFRSYRLYFSRVGNTLKFIASDFFGPQVILQGARAPAAVAISRVPEL